MSMQSAQAADNANLTLAEIFPESAILVHMNSRSKEALIQELVRHLINVGSLAPESESTLVAETMARETLGTTALGNGVAFPHCRTRHTDRFMGALGIDQRGVRFESIDGAPVYAIFLLLSPLVARDQQYAVLGKIAALGRDKGTRTQLSGCRTPAAAHRILRDLQ